LKLAAQDDGRRGAKDDCRA